MPSMVRSVELQELAHGIRKQSRTHRRMIRVVAIRRLPTMPQIEVASVDQILDAWR
jgi:hypothetical protein